MITYNITARTLHTVRTYITYVTYVNVRYVRYVRMETRHKQNTLAKLLKEARLLHTNTTTACASI